MHILAQSDGPEFESSADYTFGQAMNFHLTVENLDDLETITLFFHAPEFPNTFTANVPFTPGDMVEVTYPVDLSQVRLAPFTTVTYWWFLSTSSGDDITIFEQTFSYEDNQFDWRQLDQNGFTVYWTGDDPQLGQIALDVVAQSLPKMQTYFSLSGLTPLRIYLYPTTADFRAALNITGRDLVRGHADPELGVILITAANSSSSVRLDLDRNIPHELTHFILYKAVGNYYESLPVWFNEGLATFLQIAEHPEYKDILNEAVSRQTTIPFSELCRSFPTVEERLLLSYAQSASLIGYIKEEIGDEKIREMIQAFNDGASCESVFNRVFDTSINNFERDWLRDKQPKSDFVLFITNNSLWILLLIGGFGVTRLLIMSPPKQQEN